MTHADKIAVLLAILNSARKNVDNLIAESFLGDRIVRGLVTASGEIQDAINGIADYQTEYDGYVNSGQAARDFQEGELLRQAEARND